MKSKKDNFYVVLLWGVVIYAIALLTYCTMKNVFTASSEYISAFGSILGACGAFFAAFVAAYLFNDWKTSAKYQQKKEIIDEFWNAYIEVKIQLVSLNDRATLANAQSAIVRIELFDSVSTLVTKLYYLQQKLELYFEIEKENVFWTQMELILQSYIRLLDYKSTQYGKNWHTIEARLMSDLNILHPTLYENLRILNTIND